MDIFISYRRADSQTTAGRMAEFLDAVSAVDEVFLDVDEIELGEDFEQRIKSKLAQSSHVFILIGTHWTGPGEDREPARIFADDDMVRRETRLALSSGRKVVPILLDGAPMPVPKALPSDLAGLTKLNGYQLRTAQFNEDMDGLLDELVNGRRGRGSRWRQGPLGAAGVALRLLGGAAGGVLVMLGLALGNRIFNDNCPALDCALAEAVGRSGEADALGLLWMLASMVVGLGAILPFVPRWLQRKR